MSRNSKMAKQLRKNRTYTSNELHESFGVHPRTLHGWVKDGLPVIKNRPLLVFSEDLRAFLKEKERQKKISLAVSEFLCFSCKKGTTPHERLVHIDEINENVVNLRGVCPACGSLMCKKQNKKKLLSVTPLFRTISLEDVHMLSRSISSEKTHLTRPDKSELSESEQNTHLYQQQSLI